jgi:mannitol-specific phosphotransferase system IIBC component
VVPLCVAQMHLQRSSQQVWTTQKKNNNNNNKKQQQQKTQRHTVKGKKKTREAEATKTTVMTNDKAGEGQTTATKGEKKKKTRGELPHVSHGGFLFFSSLFLLACVCTQLCGIQRQMG